MSSDSKYLVAGTIQINAKIFVWDICSRISLLSLTLLNCSQVLIVKFAYDNNHIAAVVLTNEYTTALYLISSKSAQVLAFCNFPFTIPFKIKDLVFNPNSVTSFVTSGI